VEQTKESTKNEQLVLKVDSFALKKALAREINAKYRETGNLFTDFKKGTD
jgi:hypothetical protein